MEDETMKKFNVTVNGVSYEVAVEEVSSATAPVLTVAPVATTPAPVATPAPAAAPAPAATPAPAAVGAGDTTVNAPMPGKVVKVLLQAGQAVKKGEVVLILEAMKMQNEISSPVAGTIKSVQVTSGQNVKPGEILAVIG
jgi:glutaconyl-CoA/methylmalonyl-CoA decarboxylase subunit gamma